MTRRVRRVLVRGASAFLAGQPDPWVWRVEGLARITTQGRL